MNTQEQQIEQYVAKIKELTEINDSLRDRVKAMKSRNNYKPFANNNLDDEMKLEVLAEVYGKLKYTNYVDFREKLQSLVK